MPDKLQRLVFQTLWPSMYMLAPLFKDESLSRDKSYLKISPRHGIYVASKRIHKKAVGLRLWEVKNVQLFLITSLPKLHSPQDSQSPLIDSNADDSHSWRGEICYLGITWINIECVCGKDAAGRETIPEQAPHRLHSILQQSHWHSRPC